MIRAILLLFALALPAAAEDLVSPQEFDEFTKGYTLFFEQGGAPFGAETYRENRSVTWQYSDGSCADGFWFPQGEALCFVYENDPIPQCWLFSRRDGDFFARVDGRPAGDASELRMSERSPQPLLCNAPDLGV